MPHNGRKRGVLFRCAEQAVIREQSMWIDWRELPFTVAAFAFATAFTWGIAHLG